MGWGVKDYPGEPPEKKPFICPVCGWECTKLYTDENGNVIECDNVISELTQEDWEERNG